MNRGAPLGNNNAGGGKTWRDALDKAVKQYTNSVAQAKKNGIIPVQQGQALHLIATRVVKQALQGNKDAIAELGNRLDGKPHQSMDIGVTDNTPVEELSNAELASELAATRKAIGGTASKAKRKPKSSRVH